MKTSRHVVAKMIYFLRQTWRGCTSALRGFFVNAQQEPNAETGFPDSPTNFTFPTDYSMANRSQGMGLIDLPLNKEKL